MDGWMDGWMDEEGTGDEQRDGEWMNGGISKSH